MVEYMLNPLVEYHCYNDVLSQIHPNNSTKKVLEAMIMEHISDNQEELETKLMWNTLFPAADVYGHNEAKIMIKPQIAHHLVDELALNFVKMHLLKNITHHIQQRGVFECGIFELPEKGIINLKQAYQQSTSNVASFKVFQT